MSVQPQGGQFRRQDWQVTVRNHPAHEKSHSQWRWDQRAPDEWEEYPVDVAWREAEIVDVSESTYRRYHAESGMLLVAAFGVLQTCWPAGGQR